jgi:hypothetical protein
VTIFWWLVLAGSALCLGWFLGRWRGAMTYLVGGSDGRANWSRVTALNGNLLWAVIVLTVLARLDVNAPTANDVLWILAVGTLGALGINLGQYGVNTWKAVKSGNGGSASTTSTGAVKGRDSGLQGATDA